jgi:hypothetical protein
METSSKKWIYNKETGFPLAKGIPGFPRIKYEAGLSSPE